VRLRGQVVDFVGLGLLDDPKEVRRIGHVAVVQMKGSLRDVRIDVQMVDSLAVERRSAALHPVNLVPFLQEKLCQVAPILPCDPSNQRRLNLHSTLRLWSATMAEFGRRFKLFIR